MQYPLTRPTGPRPPRAARTGRRSQRGATLMVVAALMLAIGLMGLTAFQLSRGQYLLAGNLQHQEQAFAKVESTVAVAEKWLLDPDHARSAAFDTYDTSTGGLYPLGKLQAWGRNPETMAWTDANSVESADGRYLIERLARRLELPGASLQLGQSSSGACRAVDLFRVVASASSVRRTSRMVETLFATDGCY